MPMPLSQFLSPLANSRAAVDKPAPVLGMLPIGAAEFSSVRGRIPSAYISRELRARKMRTVEGVYDEFAAAFQFPYYFGENKDAFDECLRDLDEFVGPAKGYVAVIRNAALLLADQPAERPWFAEAMTDCATRWSKSDVLFRVVLQDAAPAALAATTLSLDPDET
ncbi:barstar family protein [Nocardia huaxiensis]|uniref:Barstar family protein n=1 Tax=Nocardia huaxiensis TaxID=2755382 RepID=A0A7D6VC27_9NOCA|nr:barstar family protein [Nocardia huaxiensis]QLY31994.1 barstar family protein [Nocardia huaxiensis]UFS95567.1 barstar family protein [Nocardia huaxiensis]